MTKYHKQRFKKLGYVLGILLMLVTPAPNLAAFTGEDAFSGSDIPPFANVDAIACDPTGGSSELIGGDNDEKIYSYFLSKGLSAAQAAGAFGNIYEESRGDPTIAQTGGNTNDPSVFGTEIGVGKAWGLIQWDAGGRAIEYARTAGISEPIYLLKTQLDLIWWHMEVSSPTGYSNMLKNYKTITSIEKATYDFHEKIEGSSDDAKGLEERVTSAKMIYLKYGDGTSIGIDPTKPTPAPSPCLPEGTGKVGGVGSIVETAFRYAWPKAYTSHHYENKPEYEEATQEAYANGEYVGPISSHLGVDCGGYVTRVMRNSGADPEYNDKNSGVADQRLYLMNSGKYERVDASSTGDLKPGDIAIRAGADGYRHTYIYVGPNDYLEDGRLAVEASYGGFGGLTLWLAPQAALTSPYNAAFEYYRLIDK